MSYSSLNESEPLTARLKARLGQRTTGLVVALFIEAILLFLLLTLSQNDEAAGPTRESISTFDASSPAQEAPEPEPSPEVEPAPTASPSPQPVEPLPVQPQSMPTPRVVVPVPRPTVPAAPPSPAPAPPAPPRQSNEVYGPPAPANRSTDSQRVGTAPNGEPLYAAQWYREPSDRMLGDYLSGSRGPGWGQIACRTVPDWRVEDCVIVGESPRGSNIAQAVLAAAWEFQVRPPRLGGRYQYGEWVRIHIDYTRRR